MKKLNYTKSAIFAIAIAVATTITVAETTGVASSPLIQQGQGRGQGQRHGRPKPTLAHTPVEAVSWYLKLSADQVTQFKAIQKDLHAQIETLLPKPDGQSEPQRPDKTVMDKVQSLSKAADDKLRALLTTDQASKLDAMFKEFGMFNHAHIPCELLPDLNLSDGQIAAIQQFVEQNRPTPGEEPKLSPEEFRSGIHALLTQDQIAKIKAFKPKHRGPGGPGGGPGGPGMEGGPAGGGPEGPGGPGGGGEGGLS